MRIIIFILTWALPALARADLFTPPPTDKSIEFLGHLFGPAIGKVFLGGSANPALLHMFERFNAALIILGVFIISYIALVSIINTAQEGQVMGRKWNSLWIPARSLMGMLLLIPSPQSGYSIMQNLVIWCIVNGVGAADLVWNGILNDLGNGASATQAINRPAPHTSAARVYDALELLGVDLSENLLRSAVCMQTIQKMANGTAPPPVGGFRTPHQSNVRELGRFVDLYETIHTKTLSGAQQASVSGTLRIGVHNNTEFAAICGQYDVVGSANRHDWDKNAYVTDATLRQKAQEIYQHKAWALQLILQNFMPLANKIVHEEVTPRNDQGRLMNAPDRSVNPGGYRNSAVLAYREILKNQIKPQAINAIQNIIYEGKNNGWVSAGSFYFTLNQTHPVEFYSDIITPIASQNVPKCDIENVCSIYSPEANNSLPNKLRDFLQYGPEISYMATRLWDAKIFLEQDDITINEKLSLLPNNKQPASPMHDLQMNMFNLLQDMMSEQHSDPLIAQGKFGNSIMVLSERSWLDPQNELETMLNRAKQGHSNITEEFVQKVRDLSHKGALAMAIYSIVWIIGAVLAIYVPLVPYLIFTISVVGWLLLVIEAVVASPILAVGFMLPSNDELGKMVQGLLLLLNIIMRPALMLFGFIFATRLYQVCVKMVNFGMLANFSDLYATESLFAWVGVLALYATFVIALSNKAFSLIHALPDKVLRWIGGMPEQSDPSQELHFSKSSMQKGADTVNKISLGIPERNFARLQDQAKELFPPDAVRS